MKRKIFLRVLIACLTSTLFLNFYDLGRASSEYPTKAIEIIMPFNPGGGADVAARLFAAYLSKKWNVPVNVLNKTGGAGIIGTRDVLVATPDGYTMLGEGHATSSLLAAFQENLPFQWDKRTFICRVTLDPLIYLVRPDAPWKSLKEVADFTLKNPKVLRWGNGGLGGVSAAAGIQFFMLNKIPLTAINRVVFQGESPVLAALAGSHIDFAGQQTSASIGMVSGKKIRPLAVVSGKRFSDLPDVPTVGEMGFPQLDVTGWHGISGPPGLPEAIVQKWAKTLEEASTDPVFLDMASKVYKVVNYLGPKDFKDFVMSEYDKYLAMGKEIGIRK
jgi:tripartite-type tricarboxylate transporter receptor subunit TctC